MSEAPPFSIDRDDCVGHGRCYSLAPAAFVADDMGLGHVRNELAGSLDRDLDAIVNACPEGAVVLLDPERDDRS